MKPLLSIAIITYNQESFVSQTLDSILSQQHNYPYEVVIGDDCSHDSTRRILLEYQKNNPDIIKLIFNENNLGIIKNYFNVIQNCSGEFIMECAGDDYWLPEKISCQMDFMINHPDVGLCYTNAITKNEDSGKEKMWNPKKNIFFNELLKANCIPALSVCFKKSLCDKYIKEINPVEKKWLMEDYPMWLYFAYNSRIQFIDRIFCVYRDLNDSESHSYCNIEKRKKFTESTIEIQKYFSKKYKIPLDENYFNQLRSDVYKDYLLNSKNFDRIIAEEYLSLLKTVEKNKIKFFIKKIIFSHPHIFYLYRNKKNDQL